jgi:DNA-binding response OmpR family regulator
MSRQHNGQLLKSKQVDSQSKSTQGSTRMERPKILIVDDDPDLRRAMKIRLRANHYDAVQASDGHSAIAMAQKEQPSLIILDLGLPAGDGFAVLKRLQDAGTLSRIPVIVLTGRGPQFNEQQAMQAGAAAFFQKPADDRELLDVIRKTVPNTWPATTLLS